MHARLSALALLIATCAPAPAVASPSPTVVLTRPPVTAPPTTSASPVTSRGYALICGTIADFVSGSFVLNSPGRDPIRVSFEPARIGAAAGYVCVQVQRGTPDPVFDGFFPGGVPQFIPQGTTPATAASPAPIGFVLPQACAYVATPIIGAAATDWYVECGAARDRDIRGTLAPELTRQGWTLCGSGLAAASWRKNGVLLGLAESALSPGDSPRVTQFAEGTGC